MKTVVTAVIVLVVVLGIAILVLMPREFRLELSSEEVQKKAEEDFPQITGKAQRLETALASQLSLPQLPGSPPAGLQGLAKLEPPPTAAPPSGARLPRPPGVGPPPPPGSGPPRPPGAGPPPPPGEGPPQANGGREPGPQASGPQLPAGLPTHLLVGVTLHPPELTLSDGKISLVFDHIEIRVTAEHLCAISGLSELSQESGYLPVSAAVRARFPSECALTERATMRKSGRDTWLISDGDREYTLTREEETIHVFTTKRGGQHVRGFSSRARAALTGELEYEREEYTVFFQGMDLHELTIEKLARLDAAPADSIQEMVRQQIKTALTKERVPVADLQDTAEQKEPKMIRVLGRLFLKDVVVQQDKLTFILGT